MDFTWIRSGANKAAAREAYENGGEIELDWWDRLRGATEEDAENAYNRIQQRDVNRQVGSALATSGKSGALWGETLQQAQGRAAAGARGLAAESKKSDQDFAIRTLGEQNKVGMAQIAAGRDATNAQLELSRLQNATQLEMLRNERADARDARADELEYRRMQDRKEDLRYNENLERMDRKDRQASINTLVQGLAALGAAFAA